MKKLTPTQIAYNKQYNRIKNFIKRAEKRGYIFQKSALPKKLKRPTSKSVEKLKSITPEKLYKKSSYITSRGTKVKGTTGRELERSEASKRAAKTRRLTKEARKQQYQYTPSTGFQEQRAEQDKKDLAFLETPEGRAMFNEGEIVYNSILEKISEAERDHPKAARLLREELQSQINEYGRENVLRALASASEDAISLAETVLNYSSGSDMSIRAIYELNNLITGEIITLERAQELEELFEEETDFYSWYVEIKVI